MKVMVSEGKLGVEYISDAISSCEQNGIECIADDESGIILFYDPKRHKYADSKFLMNSDVSIHELLKDIDLYEKTMQNAGGESFKKFAIQWNDLQKKEDGDGVYKSKVCNPIRGNFAEGKGPRIVGKRKPSKDFMDKVEKFRRRWKALGDKKEDDDGLSPDDKAHLEKIKNMRDEFGDRVNGIEAQISEGTSKQELGGSISEWYRKAFPTDSEMADEIEAAGSTFYDVWRALNLGQDVYDAIGGGDSIVRERVFQHLSELTGKRYRTIYNLWLKDANESCSGMDEAVIYFKDKSERPMPLKTVHDIEGALNEIDFVCAKYPEGDFPEIDRIEIGSKVYDKGDIDRFRRKQEQIGIDDMYSENIDDSDDWSVSEDEVEVQWMIDDKELGIESGSTETVVIDLGLVDCFEELVHQVELALEKAHGGMQFNYDDEWILVDADNLLKRFGYNMNESESNGRTFDDSNDWSASEGEIEIMWTVDYPDFGIDAGNTETFVVDYDNVAPDNEYDIENNGLRDEVCRLISDEYPGLDFEPYDFDITNEREFWGVREQNRAYPYDESGNFDTVEGIPNWAAYYIEYGEGTGDMTEEDVKMVDDYLRKLDKQGIHLIEPIEGTENEFNPYPAFGDACDTTDWTCEID